METPLQQRLAARIPHGHPPRSNDIVIGKDVLELVSSAMYVDPLTIYREYVQNAADSIDQARERDLLKGGEGRVDIELAPANRTIRIRDNGEGLGCADFARTLLSFGGSRKRGSALRGFRGVGRLAGLAYAQELIFRSRTTAEEPVSELRWDCRKLKAALRDSEFEGGIDSIVQHVAILAETDGENYPSRFFEVELKGVVRLRADRLMTPAAVTQYLGQHAPVPFAPTFRFGSEIAAALHSAGVSTGLNIHIDGAEQPIYRPHADTFDAGNGRSIAFEELDIRELPDMDGGRAALVWVLHHAYEGAIPQANLIKGLRMRVGDVQVGGEHVLDELFVEPRFNSWSVGEIHVLDRRVLPNGRRDDFEQNVHLGNLLNHLNPVVRDISKRCRTNSIQRNWLRKADNLLEQARRLLREIHEMIDASQKSSLALEAQTALAEVTRIAAMPVIGASSERLQRNIEELQSALQSIDLHSPQASEAIAAVAPLERPIVERLIDIIYQVADDQRVARKLVARILSRLAEEASDNNANRLGS